jgi:hypothetical protein
MRITILAVAVALGACGKVDDSYPHGHELNFTRACEAQGAPATLCACVWDKIEAEIPRRDFEALERLPITERTAHPLQRQIAGYALACAAP